ncbi:hypothetical protein FACS189449_10470 [Alphaproteobacteria bacterium]|nr:hypothetical protein FACS189449_10470 [Alphaproteobacteria bacterium]
MLDSLRFCRMLRNSGIYENHRELLIAAACGLCSAFLFVLGFFGGFFASVVLCFAFLSYGKLVGIVSSTITFAVIVLLNSGIALEALCVDIIPTAVVGYSLLRNIKTNGKIWWYPESFVLRDLVLVSLLLLVLMSITTYSEVSVRNRVDDVVRLIIAANASIDPQGLAVLLKLGTKYFLGLTVFANVTDVISSFLIAHSICKYRKKNIRPSFDTYNISISPLLAVFPLVALTVSFACEGLSYLFNGLAIASLVAPLMSGLSIVHFFANGGKYSQIILVMFYLMLLLMCPLVLLSVVLLGAIDSFYAIRPLFRTESM